MIMKKLNLWFTLMLVALLGVMTSCEDDADPVLPSLQITSGSEVTTTPNSQVTIKWRADAGDASLSSITITEGNSPITGWNEKEIPSAQNDTYIDSAKVSLGSDDLTFTVTVTDRDGLTISSTVNVTVEETSGPIEEYSVQLGSYDALTGSSFASIDGQVYTWSNATGNSTKIDLVYFHGSSNGSTIAAPNDDQADIVFDFSGWGTLNATKFTTTTISASEFDAIEDDGEIVSAAGGASASLANQLEVGDVFAFQTASTSEHADKMGLIKVSTITGSGGNGTINIVVKVQQ